MKKNLLLLIILLIASISISSVFVYDYFLEKNKYNDYTKKINKLNENITEIQLTDDDINKEIDKLENEKKNLITEYSIWENLNQKILENIE